jgi:predicted protein tyrosine phosphatase
MTAVVLTGEHTTRILFICISNRLSATSADSPYGCVANGDARASVVYGCRAETECQDGQSTATPF